MKSHTFAKANRGQGPPGQVASLLQAVARQTLPVIEDALREGLAAGGLTQGAHEAEGLRDRQVRLHLTRPWLAR